MNGEIMMTLKETLNGMDRDTQVKIGSAGGSGFFYLGTAGDFLSNHIVYDKAAETYAHNRVENAKDTLITQISFFVAGMLKRRLPDKLVDKNLNDVVQKSKSLDKYKEFEKERKPLLKRQVKECFAANPVSEPTGVIVIVVEGFEFGLAWTFKDAEIPQIKFSRYGMGDE